MLRGKRLITWKSENKGKKAKWRVKKLKVAEERSLTCEALQGGSGQKKSPWARATRLECAWAVVRVAWLHTPVTKIHCHPGHYITSLFHLYFLPPSFLPAFLPRYYSLSSNQLSLFYIASFPSNQISSFWNSFFHSNHPSLLCISPFLHSNQPSFLLYIHLPSFILTTLPSFLFQIHLQTLLYLYFSFSLTFVSTNFTG